jgi:phosphomannomutase
MAAALKSLLDVASVAVISGGDWPQLKSQVVDRLPPDSALDKLFIMPTTGTKLYRFDGAWRPIFAEIFGEAKRKSILAALATASASIDLADTQIWGERVEDRGSQITFSGLGQEAPIDAKKAWDPNFTKRKALQAALQKLLPDLSINVGGSTSIDITQKGVDKAYGMRKLAEHSGVAPEAMLFLGDAIYPGGNDYAVQAAGIDSVKVRDVDETIAVVTAVIACLRP